MSEYLRNAKGEKQRIGDPLGVLGRGVVTRVSATVNSWRGAHPVGLRPKDGGAQACSITPQAAGTSTLIALRPPLGACDPRCQTSFLALGSL